MPNMPIICPRLQLIISTPYCLLSDEEKKIITKQKINLHTTIYLRFEAAHDYDLMIKKFELQAYPDFNTNSYLNDLLKLFKNPYFDFNYIYNDGMPLIFLAAKYFVAKAFQALLNHPNFNVNIKFNDESLLFWAAKNDKIEVVKVLLAHKDIDLNLPEYEFVPEIEELLVAKRMELLTNNVKVNDDDLVIFPKINNETKNESEEVPLVAEDSGE